VSEHSVIAAVDLGSNSFRLQVARVVDDQIYPLDSLKETVRLASGLREDKSLDEAAQTRALACLKRFNERLRGLPPDAVRAVATNTFRVAKNAKSFLKAAESALGCPIEIVAGKEEARLIYLGVSHGLPRTGKQRLVVDIGGGSTEFIIGTDYEPHRMESLYMGCVTFSQQFFPDGKISKHSLQNAEVAARAEVQAIAADFGAGHWDEAIGSSGTARALSEVFAQNGWSDGIITVEGLTRLRDLLLQAGDVGKLKLTGLQGDRLPVIPGGYAVMAAVFAELGIERMSVAEGALREGVLYDLVGRIQHHDQREATVLQFMRRYHVDEKQAVRVERTAEMLMQGLARKFEYDEEAARQQLSWAARLHEIGISIAHAGYHKHSAYVLDNADMPGFSRSEQARLAVLVRAHRGGLAKCAEAVTSPEEWLLIGVLRLAVLLNRSRVDQELLPLSLQWKGGRFRLSASADWARQNPLTEALIENERQEWRSVGIELEFVRDQAG
jgi:exopolyphosphatase/guanosine-5'-triphosphate,3'-diphosphate pyrophosphatase